MQGTLVVSRKKQQREFTATVNHGFFYTRVATNEEEREREENLPFLLPLPLNPNTDMPLISLCNITACTNKQVMRIEKMITTCADKML